MEGVPPAQTPAQRSLGSAGKGERLRLFSSLVEARGFIWDLGSFCTASSTAGLCRRAGEWLMYSWIYLMNRLCSFCCFLICISSSCQPKKGE